MDESIIELGGHRYRITLLSDEQESTQTISPPGIDFEGKHYPLSELPSGALNVFAQIQEGERLIQHYNNTAKMCEDANSFRRSCLRSMLSNDTSKGVVIDE